MRPQNAARETLNNRQVKRGQELPFVLLFALGLILLTGIPYWLGSGMPDAHSHFNGNLVFDSDINAYFAFMKQAQAGQWLFYNPFTPEAHGAVFFNLEWLLFGKISAWTGFSLEETFQLQRITSIFLYCCVSYWLLTFFFHSMAMRRYVFTMIVLGGGFGWLRHLPWLGPIVPPFDFLDTYTGLHPFFSILLQPHFLLAQACSILTVCLFLGAEQSGLKRKYVLAGLCCALAGCIRPFDMLFLFFSFSLYLLGMTFQDIKTQSVARVLPRLTVILIPLPLFAYYLWLLKVHPIFRWWSAQNILPPPLPSGLVVSLGLVSLLLVLPVKKSFNSSRRSNANTLMSCCFLAAGVLLYCYPILTFSMQFCTLIMVPAILAGTQKMESRFLSLFNRGKVAMILLMVLLCVNSFSSFLVFNAALREVISGRHRTDSKIIAAYEWLDKHTEPREVVLPSAVYPIGNQIPRYSHNSVVSGYEFNTVNFREKNALIQHFFQNKQDDVFRKKLINEFNIKYVFYTPWGNEPNAYDPDSANFLIERFRNNAAVIYEVMP